MSRLGMSRDLKMDCREEWDPFIGEKPIWQQNADRRLSDEFIRSLERASGCMEPESEEQ